MQSSASIDMNGKHSVAIMLTDFLGILALWVLCLMHQQVMAPTLSPFPRGSKKKKMTIPFSTLVQNTESIFIPQKWLQSRLFQKFQ